MIMGILLVHLSQRLMCTVVIIMRCPSSAVVNFSHFWLLLWNWWTEFNKTDREGRSQRPLQSLCFSCRSEKQDGRPGLWLAETFSTSSLKPKRNSTKLVWKKDLNVLYQVCVFGAIRKTRWSPWPLIRWDIFDFSSEPLNKIQRNLTRS